MTRSRATAKKAGASFERLIADHLADVVDDRIDRRVKTGAADKGDIGGVRTPDGRRVVIECKNYSGRFEVGAWLNEANNERLNDGAAVGLVVAKRRGTTNPAEQVVFMTVRDLTALLTSKEN
ncbi:putative PDDEXK endonuclease [Microbacterium sp. PA5]|uniref:putative PDDEXK endonuclease n=1 Tax=Microbacterium sp. PA5 TaxID=3416654 RepID=UPI003CF2051A